MKKIDRVYKVILELEEDKVGISAMELSEELGLDRSTISRYLNNLYKEDKIEKLRGRPVLYRIKTNKISLPNPHKKTIKSLDKLAGANKSLSIPIERAKAAIIYPPRGLHTLILGETGVGKSLFAEQMYEYAKDVNILDKDAPFISFNCADYANNPNLLTAHIFGVKRGTFTGAETDKDGLLKKANKGILFLDEIHRLTPEGQEMLFTYIDNGYFKPLGETQNSIGVDVRIIAATTEKPESYLLQTFSRRIPMVITLPSLRERSLEERYSLIETFIREESRRLGESIYINKNSLISYILYDCPNNIGQLKSDIQLACAKAFLNYKSKSNNILLINQADLPNHVRKGILHLNEYRNEINDILRRTSDILKYSEIQEPSLKLTHEKEDIGDDFYNIIEQKIYRFKKSGMDEKEINQILSIDIESHFQKYIGEISSRYKKDEILNIVDKKIISVVEEILVLAKDLLNREYDDRIYFGLSLHLERSIDRIKNGEKIYNPKLNFIRINYEDEFIFGMKIAKLIDNKFNIETPVDEIGYLAMFFASDYFKDKKEIESNVRIVVIMHGRSTASSMVEVVNTLIGSEFVVALDMPLSMNPQRMYDITKEKIIEISNEKGVILMADMGSLTNFGHMIQEETGIKIKAIDRVTTIMVLDAARKAMIGYNIDEIVRLIGDVDTPTVKSTIKRENIILCACFTGDGVAKKISEVVKNEVNTKNVKVVTINIIDDIKLEHRIAEMEKKYNILLIISAVKLISPIPFIDAIDVFSKNTIKEIQTVIEEAEMYEKIWQSLKEHLINLEQDLILKEIKYLINNIEEKLNIKLQKDVKMGMALHICFMIDSLLDKKDTKVFENLMEFKKTYFKEMEIVDKSFETIEKKYNIKIGDNEMAYIVKLFIENKDSVQ